MKVLRALSYFILIFGGLFMLFPLLYSIISCVSTVAEYNAATFLPIPKTPFSHFGNFTAIFKVGTLPAALGLTLARIAVNLLINIMVASFAGFCFAKVRFKFKRTVFTVLLISMMVPGIALLVPSYIWLSRFPLVGGNNILGQGGNGFIDNPAILFITGWVNVYNIFLFRQCFVGVGGEIAESAEIDGAGFARVVLTIYLPLIRPILFVLLLNSFIGNWNDYMTTLIYFPTNTGLSMVATYSALLMDHYMNPMRIGGSDYPKAFAVALVMMVPPIVLYLFVQRQFIEGLSMGAVKG